MTLTVNSYGFAYTYNYIHMVVLDQNSIKACSVVSDTAGKL